MKKHAIVENWLMYALSPPHTRANGCATGRLQQTAHVRNAREPRLRIHYTRIWPRAAVRQISVVFDIFRLEKAQFVHVI